MSRKLLQARCDPDTAEQVEKAEDEMDISKSEFVRRALREKLIHEGYRETAIPTPDDEPDDSATKYVVGDADLLKQPDDDTQATASVNETVRLTAGAMMGLAILIILLLELGAV